MNRDKFENAALFICENSEGKMTLTRLGLFLWLIDKTAFLCLAHTITGSLYKRRRYGPTPDIPNPIPCDTPWKANFAVFDADEMKVMRKVMQEYGKMSCEDLVKLSHDLAWAAYEDGEVIPFEAYLSSTPNADSNPDIRNIIAREEAKYTEGE